MHSAGENVGPGVEMERNLWFVPRACAVAALAPIDLMYSLCCIWLPTTPCCAVRVRCLASRSGEAGLGCIPPTLSFLGGRGRDARCTVCLSRPSGTCGGGAASAILIWRLRLQVERWWRCIWKKVPVRGTTPSAVYGHGTLLQMEPRKAQWQHAAVRAATAQLM